MCRHPPRIPGGVKCWLGFLLIALLLSACQTIPDRRFQATETADISTATPLPPQNKTATATSLPTLLQNTSTPMVTTVTSLATPEASPLVFDAVASLDNL